MFLTELLSQPLLLPLSGYFSSPSKIAVMPGTTRSLGLLGEPAALISIGPRVSMFLVRILFVLNGTNHVNVWASSISPYVPVGGLLGARDCFGSFTYYCR